MTPKQLRIAAEKAEVFFKESYLEWQTNNLYEVATTKNVHVNFLSSVGDPDSDYFTATRNTDIFTLLFNECYRISLLQTSDIKWATIKNERGYFLTLMDWRQSEITTSRACMGKIPDDILDFLLPLSIKNNYHIDLMSAGINQADEWRIWRDQIVHSVLIGEADIIAPYVKSITGKRNTWKIFTNVPELRHWWLNAASSVMNEDSDANTLPNTNLFSDTQMGMKVTGNSDLSHLVITNYQTHHLYAFYIPLELRYGLISWAKSKNIFSESRDALRLRRRFFDSDMVLVRKHPNSSGHISPSEKDRKNIK